MNIHIFTRIELLFWNFAIRMLSSFRVMRSTIARSDQLAFSTDTTFLWVLIGLAGVTGLVSGYLFYFITASMR